MGTRCGSTAATARLIAASAGIARANNRQTVREVRHRFRLWRRQLKLRGDSDGDDDDEGEELEEEEEEEEVTLTVDE